MENVAYLFVGFTLGTSSSLALAYLGYNFGRATVKQIDLPPLFHGNAIFKKAFVTGKKKPLINDDHKAFKVEMEEKQRG